MKTRNGNSGSLIVFFLLALVLVASRMLTPSWNNLNCLAPISWDVFGYYLYLPAHFIYHDLGLRNFAWVQGILDTYQPTIGFYQAYVGPAGDYVMKYPMGLSILYSPFFFAGHAIALLELLPADGFSLPYQLTLITGGLVYTLAGIWFLRKILLRYFSDAVAALTMVVVVAGTNYFELTAFDGAMPHNYLFTLYALILWLTIRWHEQPALWKALLTGLLAGLAILVRPTAGLILLVPLLWNAGTATMLRQKLALLRKHQAHILGLGLVVALVVSLQLIYWKMHTGSWVYYSYEKNEQLEWIAPYLWKVLFSFKKGWLIYTPVMVFALAGFIALAARFRMVFPAVLVFFTAHLLVVASWPTWWYGGSLGQRAMMESYLILALPLGALFQWILARKWPVKASVFLLLALFIVLNLFQTWQYIHFIIHPSRMTEKYYWSVFGKTAASDQDRMYLEPTDDPGAAETLPPEQLFNARPLVSLGFETPDSSTPGNYAKDTASTGNYALRLSKSLEFSPGLGIPFAELNAAPFSWIRATGKVFFTCKPEEAKASLVITCMHNGEAVKYRAVQIENKGFSPGVWNPVALDYQLPWLGDKEDLVQVYCWYRGSGFILIDDLEITLFEPKK